MERISGPVFGHYVAAYAVPADNGTYLAYAKICTEAPHDVWDCAPIDKLGTLPHESEDAALAAAERRAQLFLRLMHEYHGLYGQAD